MALKQIDQHLQYWKSNFVFKVKQRLTRIKQYLIRLQQLSKGQKIKIIPIKKK